MTSTAGLEDIPCGRFDSNLGDILQNVRQIDRFLDVMFEFLYRRTDFYRLMRHQDDNMGLPPGVARKYVMQAYMKYERLAHGVEPAASTPKEKQKADSAKSEDVPAAVESIVEVTTTEVSDLPGSPQEAAPSCTAATAAAAVIAAESGSAQTAGTPSSVGGAAVSSGSRLNPDTGEVIPGGAYCGKKKTEKKVSSQGRSSSAREKLSEADTYNGALRDSYAWCQTLKDLDLKVFVPDTVTKAKQLKVDIRNDFVKIAVKGCPAEDKAESVLVEGKLTALVRGEESIWSLDPGNCVQLNLEKRKETWWKAALVGEPEIDQQAIDNTQYVHELDEESQADYQRVMYDMDRKRQGLPTSKEEETQNTLRKAWNAEGSPFQGTEFDPSKLNISAS